jgi:hypothetical protein
LITSRVSSEPEQLRRGREFHALVQEHFRFGGEGYNFRREMSLRRGRRPGRADGVWTFVGASSALKHAFVTDSHDNILCILEIKSTDWDRLRPERVRPNVLRHISQLYRYLDHALALIDDGQIHHTSIHIVYPRAPTSIPVRHQVEDALAAACIECGWFDLLTEPRVQVQQAHNDRHDAAALAIRDAAVAVMRLKGWPLERRLRFIKKPQAATSDMLTATETAALGAYVRAIELARGDRQGLVEQTQRTDLECVFGLCQPCSRATLTNSEGNAIDFPGATSAIEGVSPWPNAWDLTIEDVPLNPLWRLCRLLRDPDTFADHVVSSLEAGERNEAVIARRVLDAGYVGALPNLLGYVRLLMSSHNRDEYYGCSVCGDDLCANVVN